MYVRNALRAQYFLDAVCCHADKVCQNHDDDSMFVSPFCDVIAPFLKRLFLELDQILLPIVAQEIASAKSTGLLEGRSPEDRYSSFFIRDDAFNDLAIVVPQKYPFLFSQADRFIQHSFANLDECIGRLRADLGDLTTRFEWSEKDKIVEIDLVGASDRHRNRQMLSIDLQSGKRLFYKPTCLAPDRLFANFVTELGLRSPYDLKCLRLIDHQDYGWIENVAYQPCSSLQQLQDFYKRAGALLACADALNYSDGHFDNVIASDSYPVLLDGETFFQNYHLLGQPSHRQDILSTHLILDKELGKEINYAAFQAAYSEITEKLIPHPINDGTDELQVRLMGKISSDSPSSPRYRDRLHTAHEFPLDFIDGFSHAYDRITKFVPTFLKNTRWWEEFVILPVRTVLRDTGAYMYLLRCIQQPDLAACRDRAFGWLADILKESPYTEYEVDDILDFNIPYFYHYPGARDLYDGQGRCYKRVFERTAKEEIQTQLLARGPEHKGRCIQILERHLSPVEHEAA